MTEKPPNIVMRISKWDETFETADSRGHKVLRWVSMPIGFNSHGYQSMIDEFDDEAPAIYGAWCALVALAATMPIRGVLASSRGVPLSLGAISRQTFFPSEVFRRLIEWAKRPEIGWIFEDTVPQDALTRDGPAGDQSPTSSQPVADQPATRLPDKTGQDITQHYPTGCRQTDASLPPPAVAELFAGIDPAEAQEHANKLLRRHEKTLGPELCWQIGWIGSALRSGFVSDLIVSLQSDTVRSKARYARGAVRKACDEAGFSFDAAARLVPPMPKRKQVEAVK